MLEKDNNFTGDGIWSNEQNAKQQSLEKRNTVEISDNSSSTVKKDINDNFSMEDDDSTDHNNIDNKDVILSNNTRNINS